MSEPYVFHLVTDDSAATHECDNASAAAEMMLDFAKLYRASSVHGSIPKAICIVIKPMQKAVALEKIS